MQKVPRGGSRRGEQPVENSETGSPRIETPGVGNQGTWRTEAPGRGNGEKTGHRSSRKWEPSAPKHQPSAPKLQSGRTPRAHGGSTGGLRLRPRRDMSSQRKRQRCMYMYINMYVWTPQGSPGLPGIKFWVPPALPIFFSPEAPGIPRGPGPWGNRTARSLRSLWFQSDSL